MRRILPILLLLTACDSTRPSLHRAEPVVEAYLVAGEPFGRVRLSETAGLDGTYDVVGLGLRGATVRIHEIDGGGSVVHSVEYVPSADTAGLYVPTGNSVVAAGTRYRLEARLSTGGLVTAQTQVPGDFTFVRQSRTEAVYQGSERLDVDVTPSDYPGRGAVYVITIRSLDPDPGNLTPFYLDAVYGISPDEAFDPDTLDASEIEDLRETSSPPVNEESFETIDDGSVRIRLPWFAVVFYGPNEVWLNAIDDNLNDFIRYAHAQMGGSTLSPGELPNIRDAVEGGTGVFGSLARRSIDITILRR